MTIVIVVVSDNKTVYYDRLVYQNIYATPAVGLLKSV